MPNVPNLTVRLTHTGVYADGRVNSQGVLIDDINIGRTQEIRKHIVYVPANGSIDLPFTDQVLFSFIQGDINGYIQSGQLTYQLPIDTATAASIAWSTATINTGIAYVGGYYDFAGTDNDFSPSVTFGTANQARAAHIFVVTGAIPVDEVTITVTGDSITDGGVQALGDTDTIIIPAGTAVNSYFEVKKFNGEVTIETTAGTAIACNYGWSKYYDHSNRDFDLTGLEALWASEATDSTSDIELIHHKAEGWTFNSGAEPDPPTPIAARSTDHVADVGHVNGEQGAWKRADMHNHIFGSASEGILWRVTSGSAGVANQSFRTLTLHTLIQECLLGDGACTSEH